MRDFAQAIILVVGFGLAIVAVTAEQRNARTDICHYGIGSAAPTVCN